MKFNHLNVPSHWQNYWTRYPEGHTILEALISWVSQVDDMIDNQNTLNEKVDQFRNELDDFVGRFDERLQEEVTKTLEDWQASGFIEAVISSALQWELDDYKTSNEQDKVAINTQLQENVKRLNSFDLRTFPKFGPIDLSKFEGLQHNVTFDLWRDPEDGIVNHNWKLNETGYTNFYVSRSGSASNDGKTPQTPLSRLSLALQKIEDDPSVSKAIINLTAPIDRVVVSITTADKTLTKKYIIRSENPIASNQHISSYSTYSGTTVRGACAYEVFGVLRIDETDEKGLPVSFKKASTIDECIATPDSFFSDKTNVYINRADTSYENTYVLVNQQILQFKLGQNAEVVLDDIVVLSGSSDQPLYFEGTSAITGDVILNKVDLYNFGTGSSTNGISTNVIRDIKSFNCRVFNIPRDGFNYHNTISSGGTVFEYNCYAENVGLDSNQTGNNNISTGHEGVHILRVGTKGRSSQGPMIADVNGCYSANIDVSVYDTGLTNMSTRLNSAFYFDDTSAVKPGKSWLVNCSGGGLTEFAINGDNSFRAENKIYVDNFIGYNIPEDVHLTQFLI